MFHTPAHKQSTSLVQYRQHLSTAFALVNKNTQARALKIHAVIAATGASTVVATGYLQAEEWLVSGAIETLLADRCAGLRPAKPEFNVETLRRVHTVRVYYTASPHADSPLAPHPEVQEFTDPVEAQRWATAQMKWEATVGVVCDQLGFRVEGDFVGASINKELFAQVPQLKSHH